jgi:uroporphyrinogen-III synthase
MTTKSRTQLPLQGLSVLITRPKNQAERLARVIEQVGGEAIVFPTIEIEPITENIALRVMMEHLNDYDIAVFVSANAVEQSMAYLTSGGPYPSTLIFAAIGEATKNALRSFGITNVIAPTERYDSEALLNLPDMRDVENKRIIIFKGDGGREMLAKTLRSRGATVDAAVCYRRMRSQQDPSALKEQWHAGNIHAVSAMSLESLINLYDILDEPTRRLLAATPVFVPHQRIAEAARPLKLAQIRVIGAHDDDLIEELSLLHAG